MGQLQYVKGSDGQYNIDSTSSIIDLEVDGVEMGSVYLFYFNEIFNSQGNKIIYFLDEFFTNYKNANVYNTYLKITLIEDLLENEDEEDNINIKTNQQIIYHDSIDNFYANRKIVFKPTFSANKVFFQFEVFTATDIHSLEYINYTLINHQTQDNTYYIYSDIDENGNPYSNIYINDEVLMEDVNYQNYLNKNQNNINIMPPSGLETHSKTSYTLLELNNLLDNGTILKRLSFEGKGNYDIVINSSYFSLNENGQLEIGTYGRLAKDAYADTEGIDELVAAYEMLDRNLEIYFLYINPLDNSNLSDAYLLVDYEEKQ